MSEMTSTITIDIKLDKEKVPEVITWTAADSDAPGAQEAKAMLLAFFDKPSSDTLKIDLWTKEMQVAEMDRFFYQSLLALSDTYKRATGNTALADSMKEFAQYFGEKVELIKKGP